MDNLILIKRKNEYEKFEAIEHQAEKYEYEQEDEISSVEDQKFILLNILQKSQKNIRIIKEYLIA
ncbi:hypothetical protein [Paraclostridium sordellii]|uniref:hypothetical protein n=1 Tax=Paraclostridium sordellii TaxID=1505 RepID=UPI0007105145|nr:hypothetical protein [Paeniclostridium sordellii]